MSILGHKCERSRSRLSYLDPRIACWICLPQADYVELRESQRFSHCQVQRSDKGGREGATRKSGREVTTWLNPPPLTCSRWCPSPTRPSELCSRRATSDMISQTPRLTRPKSVQPEQCNRYHDWPDHRSILSYAVFRGCFGRAAQRPQCVRWCTGARDRYTTFD